MTTKGVQNFVHTIWMKALNEKMLKKDPSLSVRAVVVDKNKDIATISYQDRLNAVQNNILSIYFFFIKQTIQVI